MRPCSSSRAATACTTATHSRFSGRRSERTRDGIIMINIAAVARPYLGAVVLTTALLTGAGIYSATPIPSGGYPEVTFPRTPVVAKKPGSDLAHMQTQSP